MGLKTNTFMNRGGGARRSAFALIAAMIATGVGVLVLCTIYAGFTFGFAVVQLNRENLRATQLLQGKMELIRLYTWNQVINPGRNATSVNLLQQAQP
ncbi:MAG: hypothetical protein JWR69_485 [Pedosphaera sp.]|nr:hypothetical protein [Pedosphaera sp.]